MTALPYDEWLKLAAERDLIWTDDNISRAEIGVPYYAIELDYINFTVNEWHNFGFKKGEIYTPADLEPFRIILTRLDDKRCTKCGAEGYPVEVIPWVDLDFGPNRTAEPNQYDIYTECKPWLSAGNGDGWTRFAFWEDIQDMPPFYFTGFPNDEEWRAKEAAILKKTGKQFVSGCDYVRY